MAGYKEDQKDRQTVTAWTVDVFGRITPMCGIRNATISLCILLAAGCANTLTVTHQYEGAPENLANHAYDQVLQRLDACRTSAYPPKDQVLYHLDVGMVQHLSGQYAKSNTHLADADLGIEQAFTKSVTRAASSMLLNDNILEYAGEDYENIYLHVFKALNYLHQMTSDEAFVEIRRMNEKLDVLENRYRPLTAEYNRTNEAGRKFQPGQTKFHNSALARYLSLLLYRHEGKADDARIDLLKISEAWKSQPSLYRFPFPKLDTMIQPSEKERLNLFVFAGRSPEKRAVAFHLHSVKDAILVGLTATGTQGPNASQSDKLFWPGMLPGISAKFEIPTLHKRASLVARIRATVDGEPVAVECIEDLESVAVETFRIRRPIIYLRSAVRSATKAFAAYKINKEVEEAEKAKKQREREKEKETGKAPRSDSDDGVTSLVAFATGIAVELTEYADLRLSQFLPARAYVGEILLPAGKHSVCIEYLSENGAVLYRDSRDNVVVSKGLINVIESCHLN